MMEKVSWLLSVHRKGLVILKHGCEENMILIVVVEFDKGNMLKNKSFKTCPIFNVWGHLWCHLLIMVNLITIVSTYMWSFLNGNGLFYLEMKIIVLYYIMLFTPNYVEGKHCKNIYQEYFTYRNVHISSVL